MSKKNIPPPPPLHDLLLLVEDTCNRAAGILGKLVSDYDFNGDDDLALAAMQRIADELGAVSDAALELRTHPDADAARVLADLRQHLGLPPQAVA